MKPHKANKQNETTTDMYTCSDQRFEKNFLKQWKNFKVKSMQNFNKKFSAGKNARF